LTIALKLPNRIACTALCCFALLVSCRSDRLDG
jgi:hypothetical protein